jgi:hypothetical protein
VYRTADRLAPLRGLAAVGNAIMITNTSIRRFRVSGASMLVIALASAKPATAQPAEQPRSFPEVSIRFEQNATDGDVEVVIEATGRRDGLTTLTITSPDGRKIVEFASDEPGRPNASGIRQFLFESPEPKDTDSVKAAFPEGTYTFEGATESGAELRGAATLSHKLPPTTNFVFPKPGAKNVAADGLNIRWATVADVAAYMIELEQEDTGEVITARLASNHTSFDVPLGFLKPATEYTLGIGTVSSDGNTSFVETSFTTAAKK